MKRLTRNLCLLTFIYISVCVYFKVTQVRLILAPIADIPTNPERMGMRFEQVCIPIQKHNPGHKPAVTEQLHAFWVPAEKPDAPVFLYLHGQDATRGKNLEHTERFHQWGWNVLVIDYRGFGESCGKIQPDEASVYEDALTALNYLIHDRQIAPGRIFICGHSLGGAVAIELATRTPGNDVAGLIVESTFTSIYDMSAERYGGLLRLLPVRLLLTERFDSLSKIRSIRLPMLFIHGLNDQKVPFRMTKTLHEAAGGTHPLCLIEGAGHENCGSVGKVQYHNSLNRFVRDCTDRQSQRRLK